DGNVSPAGGGGAEGAGGGQEREMQVLRRSLRDHPLRRGKVSDRRDPYPPLAGVARSAGGGHGARKSSPGPFGTTPSGGGKQSDRRQRIPRWRGWREAPGVDACHLVHSVSPYLQPSNHTSFIIQPFLPALAHLLFINIRFRQINKQMIVPGLALHK